MCGITDVSMIAIKKDAHATLVSTSTRACNCATTNGELAKARASPSTSHEQASFLEFVAALESRIEHTHDNLFMANLSI